LLTLLLTLTVALCSGAVAASPEPESGLEGIHREFGYLPMEDGVRLAYVVYLPGEKGRFPVLLRYTPYIGGGFDPRVHTDWVAEAPLYLRHGYAVVSVSIRGTGCSEGSYDVLSPQEARDGAVVVEWAGTQPWSSGRVGLFGNSYAGLTQYLVASKRPRHLRAIAAGAAGEPYRDAAYPGGIFNASFFGLWTAFGQPMAEGFGIAVRTEAGDESCRANRARHRPNRTFQQMRAHPLFDSWWQDRSLERMAESIEVPTLVVQAWQDQQIAVSGAPRLFQNIQAPRKMILSNGSHGLYSEATVQEEVVRWFDRWVKGEDNGIDKEPPVSVWFEKRPRAEGGMPAWVSTFSDWPIPETEWNTLHLTADGRLDPEEASSGEAEGERSYVYPAGSELVADNVSFAIPPVSWGSLTYRSEVAETDTVIIGAPALTLFLGSEQPDTDLMVALHDVGPEGEVLYLQKGFLRASHRTLDAGRSQQHQPIHRHDAPDPLAPGQVHEIVMSMFPVGHVLRKGHRLELVVMAPTPIPSPDWGLAPVMLPGLNTIHHSERHPSRLVLPVIPGQTAQKPEPSCGSLENQPCR
jgi:putative CocE/NonD family hydrolase